LASLFALDSSSPSPMIWIPPLVFPHLVQFFFPFSPTRTPLGPILLVRITFFMRNYQRPVFAPSPFRPPAEFFIFPSLPLQIDCPAPLSCQTILNHPFFLLPFTLPFFPPPAVPPHPFCPSPVTFSRTKHQPHHQSDFHSTAPFFLPFLPSPPRCRRPAG